MRRVSLLLALFLLLSSAVVFADDEKSAKEGFKEVHKGMKKVTRAVDKNAKKGVKKTAKRIDRDAKRTWKKAGHDIHKATKD